MIITVASFKGGVGKTTTAFHLAAFLNEKAKTLLVDGDPNRSVLSWAERGDLPFKIIDERGIAMHAPQYKHTIIDTEARPEYEDLKALADNCHMLILPTTPDALALDALMQTVDALKQIGNSKFKILLTVVPPKPEKDGEEARKSLITAGLPVFQAEVRRFAAYKKAALLGVPVYQVKAKNAKEAWSDYEAVGREIMKGNGQQIRRTNSNKTTTATAR